MQQTFNLRTSIGNATIIQEFDDSARHRLIFGSQTSEWFSYQSIARIGSFYGTTEYFAGTLPAVFHVDAKQEHR